MLLPCDLVQLLSSSGCPRWKRHRRASSSCYQRRRPTTIAQLSTAAARRAAHGGAERDDARPPSSSAIQLLHDILVPRRSRRQVPLEACEGRQMRHAPSTAASARARVGRSCQPRSWALTRLCADNLPPPSSMWWCARSLLPPRLAYVQDFLGEVRTAAGWPWSASNVATMPRSCRDRACSKRRAREAQQVEEETERCCSFSPHMAAAAGGGTLYCSPTSRKPEQRGGSTGVAVSRGVPA